VVIAGRTSITYVAKPVASQTKNPSEANCAYP
jgi:hypothetical protein